MSDTKKPFLPPEVLAWLRVAAIIAAFKFLGVDANTIKSVTSQLSGSAAVAEQASESVSITASNLETIVTTALQRQDDERRKKWTLTNDIARIERKIDELKGQQ